jgi:organic hydroperoxide reductase OsmC/OhrA
VDPEAMLVASLQSCHMLTFLALRAREGLNVTTYQDNAVGHLERNADRKFAVTRIELHPRATFAAGTTVTPEKIQDLHHRAHDACFIANSIKCVVDVKSEPVEGPS